MPLPTNTPAPALLQSEPEPLGIDLQKTAIIVMDMQNCFVSKGGMFDLKGRDISKAQEIIEPIKRITSAARTKGLKVVYIKHVYSPDLSDSGGQSSPNWYKDGALVGYREHPEWVDKLHFRGTWGADIVKELKPQNGDLVVEKPRFNAFVGTNLDIILKTYGITYLVFVGVATNICVEATIRGAYDLDYFPILISDAVAPSAQAFTQEATIVNVKRCYGWVTTSEKLIKALGGQRKHR